MKTAEVLLVDDNPADSDLIADVLGRNGCLCHINAVTSGAEALAYVRREGKFGDAVVPDLVILDLNLPGTDGRAVLAAVKGDPVLRKMPIVVFSTSQASSDVVSSYELGANSYVSKPGSLQDFISAVTSIAEFWLGFARLPQEEKR